METLGLIETKGLVGAIVAADTSVKSANVTLLNAEKIRGGYVTIQLKGDVGAVKAAVDAAIEAIRPFGTLVSSHVIPRMHTETTQLITVKTDNEADKTEENELKKLETTTDIEPHGQLEHSGQIEKIKGKEESQSLTENDSVEENEKQKEKQTKETTSQQRERLEKMTVHELRKLVREQDVMKDDINKINYLKKADLINSLLN